MTIPTAQRASPVLQRVPAGADSSTLDSWVPGPMTTVLALGELARWFRVGLRSRSRIGALKLVARDLRRAREGGTQANRRRMPVRPRGR